jgi:hypothetical protein
VPWAMIFGGLALIMPATVVFYDQLGCGESDRPDDPSLWRIVESCCRETHALLGLPPTSVGGYPNLPDSALGLRRHSGRVARRCQPIQCSSYKKVVLLWGFTDQFANRFNSPGVPQPTQCPSRGEASRAVLILE